MSSFDKKEVNLLNKKSRIFIKLDNTLEKIDQECEQLEQTLTRIDDTDSKVERYLEQQKVIHETKKNLKQCSKTR